MQTVTTGRRCFTFQDTSASHVYMNPFETFRALNVSEYKLLQLLNYFIIQRNEMHMQS